MKTALLIGATGLTGSQLLSLLLADLRFEEIIIFVRRSTGITHPKLQEHVIDFDHPEQWTHLVKGDVLFSALGTTIKVARNKEAQYKVDFTYQYAFAKAAVQNGVPAYVLISVSGANAKSLFFYLRMKGELEDAIRALPFPQIRIIEPGPIAGERSVKRPLEQFSFKVIRFLNKLGMGDQYRPIEADVLARAMRNAALRPEPGLEVFRLDEVFELAEGVISKL
jgi:uncharacterized protein YbjT (DUF2867 family)